MTTAALDAVVRANRTSLVRIARRHSLCREDADDAVQRAVQICLERGDVREHTAAAWLRTVCKHEAMRIRLARERIVTAEHIDLDELPSPDVGDLHDRALSRARVDRVRDALTACSDDQSRAIVLLAGGVSYHEIAALYGWSFAKVNHLIAGGRARLRAALNAIDDGCACAAHRPTLEAIVAGAAAVDDFVAVRPHLRHCANCRDILRDLYAASRCPSEDTGAKTSVAVSR